VLLKIAGHETELTARATNQIGYAYTNLKRYDDALVYFREALAYNLAAHGENFEVTYEVYNNIANVLANMGRTKEAIAAGEKAWNIEVHDAGPDNPDTLWFENNLANYYLKDGNATKAAELWADVVRRGRHRFTHGEWDLAHFLFHLGEAQAAMGNKSAARASFAESVQRFTAALGAQNPRTRNAQAALDKLNAAGAQ
jgi:serine/threonine-protein kinase